VGVAQLWLPRNLSSASFLTQLPAYFDDLSKPRCTHGLTVGQTTAICIDGQATAYIGLAMAQQVILLTMLTKADRKSVV
jgi:hypothetical protein